MTKSAVPDVSVVLPLAIYSGENTRIPVFAMSASFFCILGPVKLLTITHLAEVACKWPNLEEAQKREKLSNTILHGSTRQTPLVRGL
jgi:hypothetical protein